MRERNTKLTPHSPKIYKSGPKSYLPYPGLPKRGLLPLSSSAQPETQPQNPNQNIQNTYYIKYIYKVKYIFIKKFIS